MKKTVISAALGASFLLAAAPAFAHATLQAPNAAAGARYKAVMQIGHGCDGKATKILRVQIPEGFYDAKPMPKPGWTVETVTGDYAHPYDNHGTQMTKGVREIIWKGGELPDDFYDEFSFRGVVGPEVVAGSAIYFPTVQECDSARAEWIDVTGAEGVKNPAPALNLVAPEQKHAQAAMQGMDHGAHHGMDHGAAAAADAAPAGAPAKVGDLSVTGPFSRASMPGKLVAGGFMQLSNEGAADDRLVAAASPLAARVEIHEMKMEGDVMKMRELPDGLTIPAGASVELKPGSTHLMFMELQRPLVEGDSVPVTLTFEKAGKVDLEFKVRARSAK